MPSSCSSSETSTERAVSRLTTSVRRTPGSVNYLTLLQHDIRARLHHYRASSLVDVRDAAFREVTDQSHRALTEMRAASGGLHTVQALCTPRVHELDKKVRNLPLRLPTVAVLCGTDVETNLQTSVLSSRVSSLTGQLADACTESGCNFATRALWIQMPRAAAMFMAQCSCTASEISSFC